MSHTWVARASPHWCLRFRNYVSSRAICIASAPIGAYYRFTTVQRPRLTTTVQCIIEHIIFFWGWNEIRKVIEKNATGATKNGRQTEIIVDNNTKDLRHVSEGKTRLCARRRQSNESEAIKWGSRETRAGRSEKLTGSSTHITVFSTSTCKSHWRGSSRSRQAWERKPTITRIHRRPDEVHVKGQFGPELEYTERQEMKFSLHHQECNSTLADIMFLNASFYLWSVDRFIIDWRLQLRCILQSRHLHQDFTIVYVCIYNNRPRLNGQDLATSIALSETSHVYDTLSIPTKNILWFDENVHVLAYWQLIPYRLLRLIMHRMKRSKYERELIWSARTDVSPSKQRWRQISRLTFLNLFVIGAVWIQSYLQGPGGFLCITYH